MKRLTKAQQNAVDYFKSHVPGRAKGKADALRLIVSSKRPLSAAKRQATLINGVKAKASNEPLADLSDVQQALAAAVDRDGWIGFTDRARFQQVAEDVANGLVPEKGFKLEGKGISLSKVPHYDTFIDAEAERERNSTKRAAVINGEFRAAQKARLLAAGTHDENGDRL